MIIPRSVLMALCSAAAALLLSSCASTGGAGLTPEAIRKEVQGLVSTTFAQPLPKVHDAAQRALTSVGCNLEDRQNYFVSGIRPRQMKMLKPSGGETIKIYMVPQGAASTEVWVGTDKTFLGLAGGRNWTEPTLEEMKRLLGH